MITQFTERINAEREGTKWKPMTIGGMAVMLAHLNVEKLYILLKKCNEAKSFTALFWYHVAPKK